MCLVQVYCQKKSEIFLVSFVVTIVGITAVNDGDAGGTGKGVYDIGGGGDGLTLLVVVTVMLLLVIVLQLLLQLLVLVMMMYFW